MSKNRREFFRVDFEVFLSGNISVYGGGFFPIQIDNVSVGGMKFLSPTNIPKGMKVQCSFEILDQPFSLDGVILHRSPGNQNTEYGVRFNIDQNTSSELFKQLNKYLISERKKNKTTL